MVLPAEDAYRSSTRSMTGIGSGVAVGVNALVGSGVTVAVDVDVGGTGVSVGGSGVAVGGITVEVPHALIKRPNAIAIVRQTVLNFLLFIFSPFG